MMGGGVPVLVGGPLGVTVVPGVPVETGVGHGHVGVVVGGTRGGTVGGIVTGHLRISTGHENEAPLMVVPSEAVPSTDTAVENELTTVPVVA